MVKKFFAEFIGTLFLVFFACGIASVACVGAEGALLNAIIAAGFGLALIVHRLPLRLPRKPRRIHRNADRRPHLLH